MPPVLPEAFRDDYPTSPLQENEMKPTEYLRVGQVIYDLGNKTKEQHPSIARAKKKSRDLQKLKGFLGDGRVRKGEKAPF
jgi:hypothetical protein